MKKRRPSDIERTTRTLYDYVLLHPDVLSNKVFRHQLQQLVRLMQLTLDEDEPSPSGKSGRRASASNERGPSEPMNAAWRSAPRVALAKHVRTRARKSARS